MNSLLTHVFQGHTNNFGHATIRELIHVFFFSRDNRIGNLRPAEFGTRIPNNTLTFAVTAVSPTLTILCTASLHSVDRFDAFLTVTS